VIKHNDYNPWDMTSMLYAETIISNTDIYKFKINSGNDIVQT